MSPARACRAWEVGVRGRPPRPPTPHCPTASADGAAGRGPAQGTAANGKKLIGLTVDEVMDMVAAGDTTLGGRGGLPGIDPTLVRAVGRRNTGKDLFIVLDVAALLGPILTT